MRTLSSVPSRYTGISVSVARGVVPSARREGPKKKKRRNLVTFASHEEYSLRLIICRIKDASAGSRATFPITSFSSDLLDKKLRHSFNSLLK